MLYIQHVMKTLNILGLKNNENNRVLWQIQCSSMIYVSCIENDIEVNFTSMIVFFFFYSDSWWSYIFTFLCLEILRLAIGISCNPAVKFHISGRIEEEGPQNTMSICLVFREFD